jgi:hypothetical protein
MPDDATTAVRCEAQEGGWRCTVTIGGDAAATTHHVSVGTDDLRRFAPDGATPERLVVESFAFLLEREPRESILRAFELPVIGRYFPGYEAEIRRRLGD